eukprot:2182780-Amphidinium_carterae.1
MVSTASESRPINVSLFGCGARAPARVEDPVTVEHKPDLRTGASAPCAQNRVPAVCAHFVSAHAD